MGLVGKLRGFLRALGSGRRTPAVELTDSQKEEITGEIRKQKHRGDLAGRQEFE